MQVPVDVKCGVCKKVFCCAECRYKHEVKFHAIVVQKPNFVEMDIAALLGHEEYSNINKHKIYLFCPLCEQKPLVLLRNMYMEMLEHVANYHLPLHCRKCKKTYTEMHDLREFSKCMPAFIPNTYQQECCCSENIAGSSDAGTDQKPLNMVTISTQTSPISRQTEINCTPISIINVRWKTKGKLLHEEIVSDSVSSLKNLSSINGSLRRSLDAVTKSKQPTARTTSTPVHAEMLCIKHTERTFNASGGQVSSIYNSGTDTDHSPAIAALTSAAAATAASVNAAVVNSPSKQHLENVNRYLKVGGGRGKMTTVTPLRQVMSKSIQKAFAKHGGLPSVGMPSGDEWHLRKKIFDSNSAEYNNGNHMNSPLDLRVSPVLRRTQSELCTVASTYCTDNTDKATISSAPASALVSASTVERRTSVSTSASAMRRKVLLSSQKLTTESIVITRTQHLATMQSATSDISNVVSSECSDQSTNSASSGISSASASSVYKTCHSVEIIRSTTALSKVNIQEDFCAAKQNSDKLERFSLVKQSLHNNLAPITPITSVPGAVINKKLIRFDSPQEDAEAEELERENENESKHEAKQECQSKNLSDTDSSATDVYFTPSTTPIRSHRSQLPVHEICDALKHSSTTKQEQIQTCSLKWTPMRGDSIKPTILTRTAETPGKHNDEVFHSPNETPKKTKSKPATVGRSWSFSALLGTVMRLPSLGKCDEKKKLNSDQKTAVKKCMSNDEAPAEALIKRCASIAGSLVRPKYLTGAEQLGNLKRKRSYTIDIRSPSIEQRTTNTETIPPCADQVIYTKRFRIQGRKPIERMRQNT